MNSNFSRLKPVTIVISLALLSSPGFALDLDSLMAQSVGGSAAVDNIRSMKSYSASGTVTLNSLEGTFSEYFVAPNKLVIEMNFESFSVAQGFDGNVAWQRDHTGNVSELTGYERREVLKSVLVESFAFLLAGRVDGSVEYAGLAPGPDGGVYHALRFLVGQQDTLLNFLDTSDGLRRIVSSRLDNDRVITTLGDYHDVGGFVLPMYSRTEAPDVPIVTEVRIDWFNVGADIDPAIFVMRSTDREFRLPGNADSLVIPVAYTNGHLIVVATVNGTYRARFIIDSGASATILNKPFAQTMQLRTAGTLPARGIGGYEQVLLLAVDSLEIGSMVLHEPMLGSLDLSALEPTDDSLPFGGVIGYDFLARFPLLIDFQKETIVAYDYDTYFQQAGGVSVPFRLTLLAPTVQATIEGIPGDFILDLGNSLGIILHRSFIAVNGVDSLLTDIKPASHLLGGIGGSVGGRTGLADSLRLGDIRIDSLRVLMPDSGGGLAGSEALAGNIGNRVLENFRVLLDYTMGQVTFYPLSGTR